MTAATRGTGFETISVRDVTVDTSIKDAGRPFTRAGSHPERQLTFFRARLRIEPAA
jgi:hypothetical protein